MSTVPPASGVVEVHIRHYRLCHTAEASKSPAQAEGQPIQYNGSKLDTNLDKQEPSFGFFNELFGREVSSWMALDATGDPARPVSD